MWRIAGKVMIVAICNDVITPVGYLQVYAEHDAGDEARVSYSGRLPPM